MQTTTKREETDTRTPIMTHKTYYTPSTPKKQYVNLDIQDPVVRKIRQDHSISWRNKKRPTGHRLELDDDDDDDDLGLWFIE